MRSRPEVASKRIEGFIPFTPIYEASAEIIGGTVRIRVYGLTKLKDMEDLKYGDEVNWPNKNFAGVVVIENYPHRKEILGEFLGDYLIIPYSELAKR